WCCYRKMDPVGVNKMIMSELKFVSNPNNVRGLVANGENGPGAGVGPRTSFALPQTSHVGC
ncbi:hypothetical protein, partial [Burkholderia sp. L27(2015)]|uniref:hypothetical protein n=1 Tax=Burkholderia sp. L27(2015) TaxID=1641858 RepID=UPI001C207A2D